MGRFTPPPPEQTIPSLAELTDVDLSAAGYVGASEGAGLLYRDDAAAWVGDASAFAGAAGDTLDGPWTSVGAFSDGSYYAGYAGGVDAVLDGKFYRLGRRAFGSNGVGVSYSYDLTSGTATLLAPHPNLGNARLTQQARIGSTFYVVVVNSNSTELPELYAYYPSTDSWLQRTDWPGGSISGNDNVKIVAHRGKLYVGGWWQAGAWRAYDPVTNSWSSKAGVPSAARVNRGMRFASDGDHIYLLSTDGVFYRYSHVDNAWTSRAAPPAVTNTASTASFIMQFVGGVLYVFGLNADNSMWVYSPQLDEWDELTTTDPNTGGQGGLVGEWNGRITVLDDTTLRIFG